MTVETAVQKLYALQKKLFAYRHASILLANVSDSGVPRS